MAKKSTSSASRAISAAVELLVFFLADPQRDFLRTAETTVIAYSLLLLYSC